MKIMHLISGGDVGGAKTQVLTLLQELTKRHDAQLVCFIEGPFAQEAREMGIRTRVLKKKNPFALRRELLSCVRKGGFELLHCHGSKANLYSAWLRRSLSIPVISTVHSDPRLDYLGRPFANLTYGVLNRITLRRRDGWVAVSDSMKELLIDRGYAGDEIWTNYNGIAFPEKLPCKPRREFLAGMGLDWEEDCVIFGIAARITKVKDIPTLIRAFAGTVAEVPKARLLIAGDGEQRAELEQLARELCPAGTYHFCGWQGDMNSFYHCLDVNMLSSLSEAFPYAIPEGARMYCPTISTDVGGVSKVVVNGETGYLVDVGDWEAMRERMILLARDADLRRKLGRQVYQKVRREFSAEAMTAQQEKIYETVLWRYHRRAEGPYGALVCGAYGKGNVGDETILTSIIGQLRGEDPRLPICVMSRKPRATALTQGVSAIHIFNIFAAGRIMGRSRLYISGGGSLIQNVTSTRSLAYYLFSIAQAKHHGCKVMMYGCGIGPVRGKRDQRRAGKILNRCVDLITLRDSESRQTLSSFGVTEPEIHVTADPALLTVRSDERAVRYLERNGLDPDGKYAMFVLRPWEDARQKLDAICAAAEYVWKVHGLMPVFLCLEPNRDADITRQAAAIVKVPCKILSPATDGGEICGVIARMGLVVSMRLHALIFACGQQTQVVAISYDPKVSGFMNYLGSPNCVDLADVTEEKLKALIDSALSTDDGYADRTGKLRQLSRENGRLAGKLLRDQ